MGVNGIYGLSGSGLDIESMVKVGMMTKQNQYDKMQQTYTKNEWKKSAYLEVYDKINDYNTNILEKYKYSDAMNSRSATSSNSTIKVSANANAPAMNHTITVKNTATNAYLLGTTKLDSTVLQNILGNNVSSLTFTIADGGGIDSVSKHAEVSFSSTALSNATKARNLLTEGLLYKFNTNNLISIDKVSVSGDNVHFIGIDSDAHTSQVTAAATETALSFSIAEKTDGNSNRDSIEITYGDLAKILSDDDATFQDFVDLLNKKIGESTKNLNVTASYDEDKGFVFTNKKAGKNTVSVNLNGGVNSIGEYIAEALYQAADKDQQKLFVSSGNTHLFDGNNPLSDTGSQASLKDTGSKTFTLNVGTGTTVYDLVSAVNTAGTSIRATYDASNGTFSFYNTKTGEANGLAITTTDTNALNLLNKMGLKDTGAAADITKVKPLEFTSGNAQIVSGKNASVLVDGQEINDIETNSFTRNGVTYDISGVTSKTSATVSVTQDTAKIMENVKSFVEDYNTLLDDLYKMYQETPNSSYAPLTDAQKNEMTEDQIKKWEEKAKAGMLYHDSTLRKIIDNMRSAISESVTSLNKTNYSTAYSIGISTTGLYGQLRLDETKLKEALEEDPDSVYNVFAKLDNTAKGASDAKNGIAQRLTGGLGSVFNKATKSIEAIAGKSSDINEDSTLNTLMRNLQTRMSNFKSMMTAFENTLYKKYDAMETALAGLGTQLNYVTSMFSS